MPDFPVAIRVVFLIFAQRPRMKIIDSPGTGQTQQERFEKTRTLIFPDSNRACTELAAEVAELIKVRQAEGKNVVLGLATGSTPVPFYRELIRLHNEEGLDFGNVITFNLDEYYGLTRDHPESYNCFMRDQLFNHVNIPDDQINIPDGTVSLDEVYGSCLEYEAKIQEAGGLDLQILGIGRTGHIGFNEPGSAEDSKTRMITLDRVTRQDAAADFLGVANVPRSAITMGVGTILAAKRLVLMAWGENKSAIVQEAVEGKVSDQVSASFLQHHDNATFLVDSSAASRLTRRRHPWLVGSVNWDKSMTKRAVIWLSQKLDIPLLKLVDEDYNENGVGELLVSQNQRAYHVNIDVFNQVQHTISGWPGGKEGTDGENRPERATPFPKKVLILSPEPHDAFVGMGGTIERLIEQGHDVKLAFQTSGNLRVADTAAQQFANVVLEMAETGVGGDWEKQVGYAKDILKQLEDRGEFGIDPEGVRKLKGLILRGEGREAGHITGLTPQQMVFLDLPFYEAGRYRRFELKESDTVRMFELLQSWQPHQIYATGNVSDPSSLQALSYRALSSALERCADAEWRSDCRVWLYRGADQAPTEVHEIDMAVPMSPDQIGIKRDAVRRFQSIGSDEGDAANHVQAIAKGYDDLGMAEYEAIEAFQLG